MAESHTTLIEGIQLSSTYNDKSSNEHQRWSEEDCWNRTDGAKAEHVAQTVQETDASQIFLSRFVADRAMIPAMTE